MVVNFNIKHQIPFGSCIYVAHSLNNWSLSGSIKLKWTKDHIWTSQLDNELPFEYKYVIASYSNPEIDSSWERGKNRIFKLPQTTTSIEYWQSRKISLTLIDKKREYSKNKCLVMVTGTCGSLESPVKMQKSKVNKHSCFTANFLVTVDEIQTGIAYQYLIFAENKFGSAITETISKSQELSQTPKIKSPRLSNILKPVC